MLVHGLTFGRRIRQPVIDRLGDSVTSLAIDPPAHDESKGEPVPMHDVADQIRSTAWCKHTAWNVLGHSIAAAAAGLYAATYPRGAAS